MEVYFRCFPTVITKNPNHLIQIHLRHGSQRYLLIEFFPHTRHVTIWFWAKRAGILKMLLQLFNTFQMNGVPTRQDSNVFCGLKEKLKANRAIMVHCSFHAIVWILQQCWIAASASITVKEILLSSSSADATFIAMVLLLWNIVIEELAFGAKLLPHAHPTMKALLLNFLFCVTQRTYDLQQIII